MTLIDLYKLSNNLLVFSALLIVYTALKDFGSRSIYIKIIFFYALASALIGLLQFVFRIFFNNIFMHESGNVFVLIELVLVGLIFFKTIAVKHLASISFGLIIAYLIFYLIVFLYFQSNAFSLIRFVRDLSLIIMALSYLYYLLRYQPDEQILQLPMFWLSAAILFHFSFTLILSFIMDYLRTNFYTSTLGLYIFRNMLRVGFYLVLIYVVRLDYKNKLTV